MKGELSVITRPKSMLAIALLGIAVLTAPRAIAAGAKSAYSAAGTFVEGCSCNAPCPCQLTGVAHGCTGVGAMT